jgi:hypothetical protein
MNKPNCVIIGAAKAGTTSLYVYLSEHPDVFLPRQLKEINYFSGANDRIKTETEYLSLYNGSEKFPVRMDISTSYLYDAETPKKIRELLGPDVKIIAFLRNPVDASYSLWKQMRHFGTEPLNFGEAIAAEQERIRDRSSLQGWPPNYFYTDRFKYVPQLQRYLDRFPRDQISVFIFEEFFGALEESWDKLCQCVRASPLRPKNLGSIHNPSSDGIKSTLIRDIVVKDLWWKKPITRLMPAPLKNRLRLKLDDWNKSGAETPLENDIRRRLQNEFDDDVRALEKMLGRKLGQIWF